MSALHHPVEFANSRLDQPLDDGDGKRTFVREPDCAFGGFETLEISGARLLHPGGQGIEARVLFPTGAIDEDAAAALEGGNPVGDRFLRVRSRRQDDAAQFADPTAHWGW